MKSWPRDRSSVLTKIGEASAQLEMLLVMVMNLVLMVVLWYGDNGEEIFCWTIEDWWWWWWLGYDGVETGWVYTEIKSIWLEEQLIFDFHTHSRCRYHITWLTYQLLTFTLRKNKQMIKYYSSWPLWPPQPWWASWPWWLSRPRWPSQQWWPSYLEGSWRLYTRKLEVIWSHITSNLLV